MIMYKWKRLDYKIQSIPGKPFIKKKKQVVLINVYKKYQIYDSE